MAEYHGIQIDYKNDSIFDEFSQSLLKQFYMLPDEKSPQEAFARAALAYSFGDMEFAQRIYNYVSKQWFMFASPVLSNAPKPGEPFKGLPVSCYLTYVDDTLESLIDHTTESRWLSVRGGGIGGHWSNIRAVSDKAPGPIPFLKTLDADMLAFTQGITRRASYAAYLDIDHPDILEFLDLRTPTGGDSNRKCYNLHHAVNITDAFMEAAINDKLWNLIDPHTKNIVDTVTARDLLQKIIYTRFKTGEPYILFIDTVNKHLPEFQKKLGLKVNGSNLCIEIVQPTSVQRTAVCVLSSLNLAYFDDWKDTTIVEDLIRLLDNVTQIFIDNAPDQFQKAKFSAERERSLGLGTLGFHTYLQKNMIPFESVVAKITNINIFKLIKERAYNETIKLAKEKGPCPDSIGAKEEVRNAHLLAIAPNANSAIIACASPSIEPIFANAYNHQMRAGSFLVKNKELEKILKERVPLEEIDNVWSSIMQNQGSVQHLTCLTDLEKDVFKTAFEIDQKWLISHAADRQQYICQSQSLNLFFPHGANKNDVLATHLRAWKSGVKSLYYLRTTSGIEVDISKEVERIPLTDYINNEECLSCHA